MYHRSLVPRMLLTLLLALCTFLSVQPTTAVEVVDQSKAATANSDATACWGSSVADDACAVRGSLEDETKLQVPLQASLASDEARDPNVMDKIKSFKSNLQGISAIANTLRADVEAMAGKGGVRLEDLSGELETLFAGILEDLKKAFPPPDEAPTHAERERVVKGFFEKAEEGVVRLLRSHGTSEESLTRFQKHLRQLLKLLENVMITIGDFAEQHPTLLANLLPLFLTLLIPQQLIFGPLLRLLGFGATGPIKASAAAWAQRYFFGAAVGKGTWFAMLQQAGMTGVTGAVQSAGKVALGLAARAGVALGGLLWKNSASNTTTTSP